MSIEQTWKIKHSTSHLVYWRVFFGRRVVAEFATRLEAEEFLRSVVMR